MTFTISVFHKLENHISSHFKAAYPVFCCSTFSQRRDATFAADVCRRLSTICGVVLSLPSLSSLGLFTKLVLWTCFNKKVFLGKHGPGPGSWINLTSLCLKNKHQLDKEGWYFFRLLRTMRSAVTISCTVDERFDSSQMLGLVKVLA